jgi:hypothetical protein
MGDPIESPITTDEKKNILGPTYLAHDRADCALKLGQANEKKSALIKILSDAIIKLMSTCNCGGKCDSVCDPSGDCNNYPPTGEKCPTTCKDKGCKAAKDNKNTDCCPEGVKNKIDSGPVTLFDKDFAGLNEFVSQYNYSFEDIKSKIEKKPAPKVNGKEITVIDNGNCSKDLKDRKDCLKKNSPWYNLRLVDQLIYLKGKTEEIKSKVEKDLNNLKSAESSLGKCYLADSYVDFLKTYEQTDKQKKIIQVKQTFTEPQDADGLVAVLPSVNPSKYCQGFQYNNSSCYSQCQKVCPGTTEKDINCYKAADNAAKTKECYDNRACIDGAGPFDTFSECMTSCKQQCLSSCEQNQTEQGKKKCQNACNNNSKCVLDNQDKCLVNFNSLKDCSKSADLNFAKNCIETSASLCKYCSDQFSGYPECLKWPAYLISYSSSSIYKISQDPNLRNLLVCQNPFGIFGAGSATCLSLYPETAKCPASSRCPSCPCDLVEEKIDYFPAPELSTKLNNCSVYTPPSESSGSSGASPSSSKQIKEFRVCSAECDSHAYNDDPLTFYCSQSWWEKKEVENEKPLGESMVCEKNQEIPVGKTVDDSEKWANDFREALSKIATKSQELIEYLKKITLARQTPYCTCDSKCQNSGFACCPDCKYNPPTTSEPDADGNTTITPASCSFVPCQGSSCLRMIALLLGAAGPKTCALGEGIAYFHNQIDSAVKDFQIFVIQQIRSDIVKELNYSRQKTNSCSVNYPKETRLLSCTRVQDEIIPPVIGSSNPIKTIVGSKTTNSYCYGKALGEILKTSEPMLDNWFCCQKK